MLRSAQPSQFSTYPSQYIDTPGLAVLMILLNVLDMDAIVENKSHLMHFLLLCRIYTKYYFENSHALEFALQPEVQ